MATWFAPIYSPMIAHDADWKPTVSMKITAKQASYSEIVAYSTTPNKPATKIITSIAHTSEHCITAAGMEMLKYSRQPVKEAEVGQKRAGLIEGMQ